MKVIFNNNTILFPSSIVKQDEQDVKGKEISKNINMKFSDGLSITIVCESVGSKETLWDEFMATDGTMDLRKFSCLISGIQPK